MSRLRSVCIALVVAVACGGPQDLGRTGATCFRDDDCEAGMICVAPKPTDIHRVCSNDPTPLISMVERPPVMAAGGTAGSGGAAGGVTGTPTAGTAAAGTDAGGNASGGTAGAAGKAGNGGAAGNAAGGTDAAGTAGTSGTAGTAPDGGAPP